MNKIRTLNLPVEDKPRTYLLPSCILLILFPIEGILSVLFICSAWMTRAINMAYYSGNVQRARELSRLARNLFIAGIVCRCLALSFFIIVMRKMGMFL